MENKEPNKALRGSHTPRKIFSPHDEFFTYVFSDRENLKNLLTCYFPPAVKEHIDLSNLSIADTAFVDKALDKISTAETKEDVLRVLS